MCEGAKQHQQLKAGIVHNERRWAWMSRNTNGKERVEIQKVQNQHEEDKANSGHPDNWS